MFSDSILEIIDQLLKDVKHYSEPPFSYALDFKEEILDALTNLYYIQMRLDHPDWDKYKKIKVMRMARREAERNIEQIECDLSESYESDDDEEDQGNAVSNLRNINNKIKELNTKLKNLNDRL